MSGPAVDPDHFIDLSWALPLTGRRRPDMTHEGGLFPDDMLPGDYWKLLDLHSHDGGNAWGVAIPGGPVGTLVRHDVVEHEDGTITVEPGGFDGSNSNSIPGRRFHGWIRRGVWTES